VHSALDPHQVEVLRGSPAIHNEFSDKVNILDDRLQKNGMSYRQWDLLNDRQRDIFSYNLFLTPECATSVDDYVSGAVKSCGCADTEEDLHHHSPVLMSAIETQREANPSITMAVNTTEGLDAHIDNVVLALLESEDS